MKNEFTEYLMGLGMGSPFIKRVTQIHDACMLLANRELNDIFVSENRVGSRRTYIAVHFFTDNHVYRAKNFIEAFVIDIRHLDRVSVCEIMKNNFDLETTEAGDSSMMQVNARWEPTSYSLQLVATGDNCAQLIRILKGYILSRISP
jgi:hypothetical protein